MKRFLAILTAIIAAIVLAIVGAYILWSFHTGWGLLGGVTLVLLAVAIALPVPFHDGVLTLKQNAVLIVPIIVDAVRGGSRRTDPPADPPIPPGTS